LVDPTGKNATAVVDEENKTITVTVEIDIYGPDADDDAAEQIASEIEGAWNGKTYTDAETGTEYNVEVIAEVNVVESKKAAKAPNRIEIDSSIDNNSPVPTERSHVFRRGRRTDVGRWSGPEVAAHEAGHLMGLADDYLEGQGPLPGHEGHMMGEWGGAVDQHEIHDVVRSPVERHNRRRRNVTKHKIY
jgi:hypothetical protein